MTRWRRRSGLLLLVVAGAGARVALAALPRTIRWDEPDLLWLGRNLWRGEGYRIVATPDLHYPPLVPILFGPLTLLFDNLERVGEVWYVVCGALLPLPVFALARRLYGRPTALAAALLTAVFPLLTISPLHWGTMSEPPFLLLLFAGIDRAHAALAGGGARDHALAGLALGLAYLARPEGFLHLALAGAFLAAAGLGGRRWREPSYRRGLALFALAALAVSGPYLLYLRLEGGRWMITGKTGLTLDLWEGVIGRDPVAYDRAVAGLDSRREEILWFSPERFERPGLGAVLLAEPGRVAGRLARNLRSLAAGLVGRWPALIPVAGVAALGALWALGRGRLRDQLFLIAMALPPFAFLAVFIQVRFFAPVVPVLLIWAAAALDGLGEAFGRRLARPWTRALPAGLAAAGLLLLWPPVLARGRAGLDFGHEEMGRWLRRHAPPGAVIMARDLAVPLYARRGYCPAPHASLDEILAYARSRGATLWATDSRELGEIKPHLSFLLTPEQRATDLEILYAADSREGTNLVFALPGAGRGPREPGSDSAP